MQQGHLCDFVPSQNQDKAGNRLGFGVAYIWRCAVSKAVHQFRRFLTWSFFSHSGLSAMLFDENDLCQYFWAKFGGYAHDATM